MEERMKRSERNVKRQKDVNYSNTGWVKRLSGKKKLLSDAQDYKYKYYCEVHGWIRECGKKENKQKDLKYICVCCVKIWSELNEKWVDAQEI